MKKFSFLLAGTILLWTVAFAIAEEAKDATTAATWTTVEATTEVTTTSDKTELVATAETTSTDTAEAATWNTAEVATETVAEATTWATAEVATWDTAEVATGTVAEVTTWATAEETAVDEKTLIISESAKAKYSEEQLAAYQWAFENGITTINDADKARLSAWLTRAELAKMMSQYLTNVLDQVPTSGAKANYADVNESLGDLADYIETAYAYKIMWIKGDGTPLKNFNPKGQVTRAEYATVFSRVLYGDKYNKSEGKYYENHLKALNEAGILTKTTPTIKEVRGWVMLMMYRSVNPKTETPAEETVVEETTEAEATTGSVAEVATGTVAEVATWDTAEVVEATTWTVAPLYSEEDLKAAEKAITEEGVGKFTVKVENVKVKYMGDEKANSELKYCQELDATVEECVVFESEFYIPAQDAQMAWAFEPDTTITGYQWYLGRVKGGEWKILTFGF